MRDNVRVIVAPWHGGPPVGQSELTANLRPATGLGIGLSGLQYGVNIGSNNPGYIVRTDLFDFNGTVYDFEPGHGHNGNNDDQGEDGDN
jgi:hypothetical protein